MKSVAKPVVEGTEEDHEVRDALQPLYDELVRAPFWWALELVPERVQGPPPERKEMRAVTYVFESLIWDSCAYRI